MVRLNAEIDINAEPAHVFSLMENVDVRARLNPRAKVLGITRLTYGKIEVGSQVHYRLIVEGKMLEHSTTCTAYEPGKYMEVVSDTKPVFNVRIICHPIPGGTRLIHEESFDIEPLCWPVPRAGGRLGKLFRYLFGDVKELRQSAESIAADEEELVCRLQPNLCHWMRNIKNHVEKEQGIFYA